MLKSLFTVIGGGIKDIQIAVTDTAEYIIDEVTSIPEALSNGYEKGLITADEEPIEANAVTPAPEETTKTSEEKPRFPAQN